MLTLILLFAIGIGLILYGLVDDWADSPVTFRWRSSYNGPYVEETSNDRVDARSFQTRKHDL